LGIWKYKFVKITKDTEASILSIILIGGLLYYGMEHIIDSAVIMSDVFHNVKTTPQATLPRSVRNFVQVLLKISSFFLQ